ncbi:MAG: hypothetical protein KUA43_12430 [Hoeflea sp.]|uniref:hypothetical protein n=1 Tax=Hoeflea sp. TaxID=1940281 RepID=UPI001D476485|nr:hypothetical protein [Hoeflea sp.]MBU4527819.1 hypothetical protein [Alphaproteobacteria bacterium]MBU4546146.1 hypothetical protein [Alphaproteobacteria bacterium]MBU4553169.1 hypothetical protein [Alphaproteobacteria bacterium]MBV1724241.1 hypothetical protein [Hoeflea sp.]MBV1759926.1 hypothetical protein [Hoeflea sp.]
MRWALIDFSHPFFRPMIRRIAIVGLLVVWTVVEFMAGSTGWSTFFLLLTAYVGWGLFLSGQADGPLQEKDDAGQAPPSGEDKPEDRE